MVISVAHDFVCPWCWVGLSQVKKLQAEFPVTFEWKGYELYPDELEFPRPGGPKDTDPNRPETPSRMDLAYAAEDMDPPTAKRPWPLRTHNAHEAVEFAKSLGLADQLVERLYRAYWINGMDINSIGGIRLLATGLVPDLDQMVKAIEERRFADQIIGFDEPAYQSGVYNVPTFFIGGDRLAEQPIRVLRRAIESELGRSGKA
ncbi:MAG: DsbA family protein [Armatimonadetes bacterium]|nr:DsbA family protein [Armatimonadota bacterium]